MGILSDMKENYEKRQLASQYHYEAMQYINEGKEVYNNAYSKFQITAFDTNLEISKFVDFKKDILKQMNSIMKSIEGKENIVNKSKLEIELIYPEISSIQPATFVTGENPVIELIEIFKTVPIPSIKDFLNDSSEAYYQARYERDEAKMYKQNMRIEREKIYSARNALKSIASFISVEKEEITKLLFNLKKIENEINNQNISDKDIKALNMIADILSKTLTTQFITNDFKISKPYVEIHNNVININNTIDNATSISSGIVGISKL